MVTGKSLEIVMTTDKVTSPHIHFMQFKHKVWNQDIYDD